jgi:hypothetical protein
MLSSSMPYEIAEIFDPHLHAVAKMPKNILAQIPEPKSASSCTDQLI